MAGSADHVTRTMDEDQAVAELDQILARRKSRAAASAVKRKVRMSEEHISLIMSMKRGGIPSDDNDGLELLSRHYPELYTPEVVEERRREHEELVAMCRRDDEENEARQAEITRELGEKGYVETDKVDQAYVDEFNEWTRVQWERRVSSSEILSRMRITDEEDAEALKNFLSRQAEEEEEDYYSDEDDDAATVESSDAATVESSDDATVGSSD